jgi:hypothetical protein
MYLQGKENKKGDKKMMYEVVVAGSVIGRYNSREEAEIRLEEAKNSFFALVHPVDVFYIREV